MELKDFAQYMVPRRAALYTRIPIQYRDEFMSLLRESENKVYQRFAVTYRGKNRRIHLVTGYRGNVLRYRKNCLRKDAEYFSVYNR